MDFEFPYPQTVDQAFMLAVQLLTLLIGLFYLLVPKKILNFCGVEAVHDKPYAVGEGRSSYAGILIAFGAGCVLLQQPSLNLLLAIAWLVAGLGIFAQIVLDGGRDLAVYLKLVFVLLMGVLSYWNAELVNFNLVLLSGSPVEWVIFLVAILTFVLGLINLLMPTLALKILKLEASAEKPYGKGETRGLLAGFYFSLGFACLFFADPFIAKQFAAIIMGGSWLLIGVGRFVSIIVDRGATLYNFAALIFEFGIGSLLLAMIFGLI